MLKKRREKGWERVLWGREMVLRKGIRSLQLFFFFKQKTAYEIA